MHAMDASRFHIFLLSPDQCHLFSMYLTILNKSNGQMVGRDGKIGRYGISVEKGMALEERIEPGWVLELLQSQEVFSLTTSKDFLFYHMIPKNSGINESLLEMMKFILDK